MHVLQCLHQRRRMCVEFASKSHKRQECECSVCKMVEETADKRNAEELELGEIGKTSMAKEREGGGVARP